MKSALILLLGCLPVFAQPSLDGPLANVFNWTVAAAAPSDALSAMNPNFVWLSGTLPSGNVTTDWIDQSNSLHFKVYSSSTPPTNSTASNGGIWFDNSTNPEALTNSGVTLSGSGSWTVAWCIPNNQNMAGTGSIGSDSGGTTGFFLLSGTSFQAFYSSTPHNTSGLVINTYYTFMVACSSGAWTCWTNGVQMATGTGFPTWTMNNIGNDGGYTSGDDPLQARIQKLCIWTNAAKTITDAGTWDTYCRAHNP